MPEAHSTLLSLCISLFLIWHICFVVACNENQKLHSNINQSFQTCTRRTPSLSRSHLVETTTETETAAHAAALAVNFASHFLCKSFSIWASQLLFYFYACFFVLFYSFTFLFFSNLCALLASFLSRLLFVPARAHLFLATIFLLLLPLPGCLSS